MPLLMTRTFDSFEEFNSFPHGRDAEFRVTTDLPYVASIKHVVLDGVMVNSASYTQATLQRASTPAGRRTLALPVHINGPMTWSSHEIDTHSLMLFSENRELFSVSRSSMHIATLSIEDSLFERQLEEVKVADPSRKRDAQARRIDAATWQHLHKCLDTHCNYSEKYQNGQRSPLLERYLEEETAYQFISLALGRPQESYRLPVHAAAKHTRTAIYYIMPRLRTPLTVVEVCSATGIGRRTLEMSFRRYLGISPKRFIKQMRYALCREELLTQRWPTVSSVAGAWGFWHMGQFAADYRALFGESPRETLRKLPGRR